MIIFKTAYSNIDKSRVDWVKLAVEGMREKHVNVEVELFKKNSV